MKQMIPAPMNPRQMLMAFSLYNPAEDLPQFLARIDTDGISRRQVSFCALGRSPDTAAAEPADYLPRRHLRNLLNSDEFQTRIRERTLVAFPEKRRLVFIHIPKCAGTDLEVTLQRRYPYIHHQLAIPGNTDKAALFASLRDLAILLGLSDSIALSGHVPLRWYTERRLLRFEDFLFSTVRDPREILYSHVSYILMTLIRFRGVKRADTSGWLHHLGMADIEENPSAGYLAEIGGRLLRTREITTPNMLCHFLGTGTCASALHAMAMTDIELTDMARYSAWRRQTFGYEPGARINASQAQFTPEIATPEDRRLVDEMTAEDRPLYETIRQKLDRSDALSIRGHVFASA